MADLPEEVAAALNPSQETAVRSALRETEGDVKQAMDYALGDGARDYSGHEDY